MSLAYTAPAEPATVLPEELPTNNAADQPGTTVCMLALMACALQALEHLAYQLSS